jgi:hypothetical protein
MTRKPSVEDLGIEVDAQQWRRSGEGEGSIEIAFVPDEGGAAKWVIQTAGSSSTTATSGSASSTARGAASSTTEPADRGTCRASRGRAAVAGHGRAVPHTALPA